MIDKLAEKIAVFLRERNDGIVSVPVMKFALIFFINLFLVLTIILSLSLYTNAFKSSAIALFGFAILRCFSGGIHVKSAVNCLFISILLMSLIIYFPMPKDYEPWLQTISSLLVLFFAPAYIEEHVRIKKRYLPL